MFRKQLLNGRGSCPGLQASLRVLVTYARLQCLTVLTLRRFWMEMCRELSRSRRPHMAAVYLPPPQGQGFRICYSLGKMLGPWPVLLSCSTTHPTCSLHWTYCDILWNWGREDRYSRPMLLFGDPCNPYVTGDVGLMEMWQGECCPLS